MAQPPIRPRVPTSAERTPPPMPTKPRRACEYMGCTSLALPRKRLCEAHHGTNAAQTRAAYEEARGTTTERGYGHRWQLVRLAKLKRDPFCEWEGCQLQATDVHHIIALKDGGSGRMSNLQALCHAHHSAITSQETAKKKRRELTGRGG